jgi:hypothetical protein
LNTRVNFGSAQPSKVGQFSIGGNTLADLREGRIEGAAVLVP